ncbi:MAG TPA: hypothetical protein VLA74_03760 [Nitrososphaeraceae archaeon]|nr:hypothetical protein [Nitrososphaeraceae archaeon]
MTEPKKLEPTHNSSHPAEPNRKNDNFSTQNNYKNISYRNNNNSFANPKYFEPFQIFEKLLDIIKSIHNAKITNETPNDEQRENSILIFAKFRDAINRDYSDILGVKITLNFTSNKWNKLYSDKNQYLYTLTGFEQ